MFSQSQREEILSEALRVVVAVIASGRKEAEAALAAKAFVAAAKAIEADVGTGGSILDRARREDDELDKRAD
jgi:hypothetical protein